MAGPLPGDRWSRFEAWNDEAEARAQLRYQKLLNEYTRRFGTSWGFGKFDEKENPDQREPIGAVNEFGPVIP